MQPREVTPRKAKRYVVPPNPMGTWEQAAAFLNAQRVHNIPALRGHEKDIVRQHEVAQPLSLHHQVRHGMLPVLAGAAGMDHKLAEIHAVYDALVGDDLRYDLRAGSPMASGASGALSPFLLSMSMGARQDTAVRYQSEPVTPRRALGGRAATFKNRLRAAVRTGVGKHSADRVMAAWVAAVPYHAMALDNVRPSFGVRHYVDRGPDISAYFVLETPDPAWSHGAVQRALEAAGASELWRQIEAFDRDTFKVRGFGILAMDLDANGGFEVKLYKRSERIGPRQIARLLDALGAGARGEALYRAFRKRFVPSYERRLLGALGWVLDRGGRPPACKVYLDTSMMYDDAEAIRRLRLWLDEVGFHDGRALFDRIVEQTAPGTLLEGVGNYIDLVSLDVGASGLFKTTVYYAPEVGLGLLARRDPKQLPTWDGRLSWDAV